MSRIYKVFAHRKQSGSCALISFVTAGDPDADTCVAILHQLVAAGVDIIELGMPFSDPTADGPVIQRASERALARGMNLAGVLAIVRRFRAHDRNTPLVLMGYLNPIEQFGYENFIKAASEQQVDGVIVVDLPFEEGETLYRLCDRYAIDPILLISPTTSEARIQRMQSLARGFLYCVSIKGITGTNTIDPQFLEQRIATIRRHLRLPIGVGFGIRDAATAAQIAPLCDAVVVGSALVQCIEEHHQVTVGNRLKNLAASLRSAIDQATAAKVGG